jgi:hypothetical protein
MRKEEGTLYRNRLQWPIGRSAYRRKYYDIKNYHGEIVSVT